jgi:hypothetical protein
MTVAKRSVLVIARTASFACALSLIVSVAARAQPADACVALKDGLNDLDIIIKIPDFADRERPVCRIDQGCLEVDWNIATKQQLTETLARFRFTEKTPLKVHTTNLNFLQYSVKWSQTVERQDKAFESVSNLFEKVFPVFGFLGVDRAIPEQTPDEKVLAAWVIPLERASLCLATTVAAYTSIVVDKQGTRYRRSLYDVHELLTQTMPELAKRRLAFLTVAGTKMNSADEPDSTLMDTYWKVSERHADLERRVTEFLPLAEATFNGVVVTVGSAKRNSFVDVTGQATKRSSGEPVGEALTPRYFVAWSRPLLYHVGYGYGRLRHIDFEQVRALSGQDVFTATTPSDDAAAGSQADDEPGPEAVVFMTLELLSRGPNARYGVGFTLGTGLESPGDSLYGGGTFRVFSRVLITGGLVWARATRGEKPLIDSIVSGEPRVAYAELTTNSDAKPFFSLSFKVY